MEPELELHQKLATRNILLYAALSTLVLAAVTYWGMGIHGKIPFVFISFAICNFVILYRFFKHENLIRVYFQGSSLIFIAVVMINACSGGIDGVFNFFIPIIVLSGYSMRKKYGRFWLTISIVTLFIFYFFDGPTIQSLNEVESNTRPFFIFLSLIICTIIMGAIYGEYLVELILHGKLKTNQLRQKNEENKVLLKEIHHRVKNNMQVISGLLSLQSSYIEDVKMKEYLKISQDRIKTMAIVHEMLYQESDFTSINFYDYVDRLVSQLIISMKGLSNNVNLKIDISNVELNIDTSIPLGIIINEIVTNSLKYGIVDDKSGEISLSLEKLNYPYFILVISDNGSGITKPTMQSDETFGLNLISTITKQLKGEIDVDSNYNGTQYTLQFEEIAKARV